MSQISPAGASGARQSGPVQRQVKLPLSKAAEIAFKSIRQRLSRSLLVTSGIILALAFLMAIRTSEAIVDGMRSWITTRNEAEKQLVKDEKPRTPEQAAAQSDLRDLKHRAEVSKGEVDAAFKKLKVVADKPPAPPAGAPPFNARKELGAELPDLQKELGAMPGSLDNLTKAMTASPEFLARFKEWVALRRGQKDIDLKINAPKNLESLLAANGMPTDPAKVAASKLQTRWMLGLALLVAFVGILNSMLMSVTERFREIGTMKCLGAMDGFIVKLFVIESLLQGVVGTFFGIAIGLGLSLLGAATSYGEYTWKNLSVGSIMVSVALCFVVGVGLTVAGAVYPAWQAARMAPIEAMRVET